MSFEDRLDSVLAALFSPLHYLGIERCSRCYARVRRAQLLLFLTRPFRKLPTIQSRRIDWYQIVHPPPPFPDLTPLQLLTLQHGVVLVPAQAADGSTTRLVLSLPEVLALPDAHPLKQALPLPATYPVHELPAGPYAASLEASHDA